MGSLQDDGDLLHFSQRPNYRFAWRQGMPRAKKTEEPVEGVTPETPENGVEAVADGSAASDMPAVEDVPVVSTETAEAAAEAAPVVSAESVETAEGAAEQ